jgi:hypothetical protein
MRVLLSILISFSFLSSFAQVQDSLTPLPITDTTQKNFKIIAVPIVFYTPETSAAFGAGTQIFFKPRYSKPSSKMSNIFGTVIYTLNKQIIVQGATKLFFSEDRFALDGKVKFQVFPTNFWGLGGFAPDSAIEDFNQTETCISASLLKQLPQYVNFGFQFTFANYNVTEVDSGGILDADTVNGSSGARLMGLGVVFNVDSRDNYFAPLEGGLYQFQTNFTSKVMGSTHSFNSFQIDLRKYITLPRKQVLALQVYTRLTFGDAPFQARSIYGGADLARGYFRGRYIDQHLYVLQAEYRLPVSKRWEVAAFILTGNVGNTIDGFNSSSKSSFGFGPRYFISKNNRSALRLDIGFNSFGGSGIYFGVNEAF